jgi:hypothetical protein
LGARVKADTQERVITLNRAGQFFDKALVRQGDFLRWINLTILH